MITAKVSEAPEIMFDEDGHPNAVLVTSKVTTATKALRVVFEEQDWLLEDFPCVEIGEETDVYRPILSEYRAARDRVKRIAMRRFEEGDEESYVFGAESWFECSPSHPGAALYWLVQV